METYIINFGKYKGQCLKHIPTSYLNWLVKQENFGNRIIIKYVKNLPKESYIIIFGEYEGMSLNQIWIKNKQYLKKLTHEKYVTNDTKYEINKFLDKKEPI